MNSFWLIEDYIFANDFLRFLTGHLKNAKSHVFLKSEKKRKMRILEHWADSSW